MPCSAVTLSLATICGVASAALLGIAFGTDNWQEFKVSENILGRFPQDSLDPEVNSLYLTRTKGLFKICFDGDRPDTDKVPTYISTVETNCMNVDFNFGEDAKSMFELGDNERARLNMLRSVVGLFMVSFFLLFVSFLTGLAGCWRRSPANIGFTAGLILFACLAAAGAMGCWHGADYYEKEHLSALPYQGGWPVELEIETKEWYSWSFFLAWVGVGCSAMSSFLFFGASVCLKSERQKEESKNMAYIMPVYGQKQQQYASYGYGYPGPYHYGNQPQPQYGHYNY